MKNINLDRSEKIVEYLLKHADKIKEVYKDLAFSETMYGKESVAFKGFLKDLSKLLDREDTILNKLEEDGLLEIIKNTLSKKTKDVKSRNVISSVIAKNEKLHSALRLEKKVNNKLRGDKNKRLEDWLLDDMNQLLFMSLNSSILEVPKSNRINSPVGMFLREIRNTLGFLEPEVESLMLSNNFDSPLDFYTSSDMVKNIQEKDILMEVVVTTLDNVRQSFSYNPFLSPRDVAVLGGGSLEQLQSVWMMFDKRHIDKIDQIHCSLLNENRDYRDGGAPLITQLLLFGHKVENVTRMEPNGLFAEMIQKTYTKKDSENKNN